MRIMQRRLSTLELYQHLETEENQGKLRRGSRLEDLLNTGQQSGKHKNVISPLRFPNVCVVSQSLFYVNNIKEFRQCSK